MSTQPSHPSWVFVLFPAIAMMLGWGLRGYIGGGPFGALIPGVYVAMCLVLLLGYTYEAAAMVALFGAIGVAYGGDMTYGQTLGFLREWDTVSWGLLGCLVKGGVWGLLGGAVIGAGLTHRQFERKTLVVAFVITILAFYIGVKLINEPKLIYFSNRMDRPRDESWAGLLFAAVTFLIYLRARSHDALRDIPLRFALWGAFGGALGFGGGALWMVFGPHFPIDQRWIGWWKAMEFSFGFLFGAALGWCAYLQRERLHAAGQHRESPGDSWGPLLMFAGFTVAIFVSYPLLGSLLPEGFAERDGVAAMAVRDIFRLLFGFITFGAVVIVLGLRSIHVAWQAAITLTFFHTVFDYVRDLSDPRQFGYTLPFGAQMIIAIVATTIVGYLVYRFQRGPWPMHRLFVLAVVACYITACVRSFARRDLFLPPEGETPLSMLVANHSELIFVHGTFTVTAIVTIWFIMTRFRDESPEGVATAR